MTDSAIDQAVNHTSIEGDQLIFEQDFDEFIKDAHEQGLGNVEQMAADCVSGAVLGGLGAAVKIGVTDFGTPNDLYLGEHVSGWVQPLTQFIDLLLEYPPQQVESMDE